MAHSPPDDKAVSKEGEDALTLLSSSFKDKTASSNPDAGGDK